MTCVGSRLCPNVSRMSAINLTRNSQNLDFVAFHLQLIKPKGMTVSASYGKSRWPIDIDLVFSYFRFCSRCLCKNVGRRFSKSEDFRQRLSDICCYRLFIQYNGLNYSLGETFFIHSLNTFWFGALVTQPHFPGNTASFRRHASHHTKSLARFRDNGIE